MPSRSSSLPNGVTIDKKKPNKDMKDAANRIIARLYNNNNASKTNNVEDEALPGISTVQTLSRSETPQFTSKRDWLAH